MNPTAQDTTYAWQLAENISGNSFTFIAAFSMVGIWIFGMIIVFAVLLKKYTFGNWTKDNPNPYVTETFAMPRGVMRGMLTMSLLFIVILMEIVSLQVRGLEAKIDQLLVAFQMILAFYFGSKVMHHVTKADERKARELAKLREGGGGA